MMNESLADFDFLFSVARLQVLDEHLAALQSIVELRALRLGLTVDPQEGRFAIDLAGHARLGELHVLVEGRKRRWLQLQVQFTRAQEPAKRQRKDGRPRHPSVRNADSAPSADARPVRPTCGVVPGPGIDSGKNSRSVRRISL